MPLGLDQMLLKKDSPSPPRARPASSTWNPNASPGKSPTTVLFRNTTSDAPLTLKGARIGIGEVPSMRLFSTMTPVGLRTSMKLLLGRPCQCMKTFPRIVCCIAPNPLSSESTIESLVSVARPAAPRSWKKTLRSTTRSGPSAMWASWLDAL